MTISSSTDLITRVSSRRRVAHVVELLLQELVPLDERFVLGERERVDRAHEPQLAFELAGACRQRDTVGDLGHRRRDRDVGLAVELAAHVLDGLLEAQADLGFFDLEPADALAQLGELLLGRGALGAQTVELAPARAASLPTVPGGGGAGARRARSASPAALGEPLGDLVDRVALLLRTATRRARARASSSGRAASRASTSASRAVEHRAPFVDGRGAHLAVPARGGRLRRRPRRRPLRLAASCSVAARFARAGFGERGVAASTSGDGRFRCSGSDCCSATSWSIRRRRAAAWRSSSDAARDVDGAAQLGGALR